MAVARHQSERLTPKEASLEIDPRPAKQTISDWHRHGVQNRFTKEVVVLRMETVGGRLYTTRAWVHEFIEALNRKPTH